MEELDWRQLLDDCVDFARRLIQTPSMPGREGTIANLVADELRQLGFDEVGLDDVGNVTGRVEGREPELEALVLNAHLDHVDPGEPSLWPVPPYSAEVVDGRILGRGACDMKGPLAVQVYGLAALLRAGERPRRTTVFSGVVEEEVGGAGALHWVKNLDYPVALILLGEPSSNHLSLGHRGILEMWVTFQGRSVHASVPEAGENPNYALATFIQRVKESKDDLAMHPVLGPTTVAPTLIEVDTKSMNVTPAWTRVLLDFRTAAESSKGLLGFVDRAASGLAYSVTGAWDRESDAPVEASDETICGYYTPPDSLVAQRARALIAGGMGWEPELISYRFATDGRHFAPYGTPILGYSPGEEHLAHTVRESISIDMMADSLRGLAELLRAF
ncbi:MAG: M20 family metallopeptidase [Candidatus Promineifilaceae bacterium]